MSPSPALLLPAALWGIVLASSGPAEAPGAPGAPGAPALTAVHLSLPTDRAHQPSHGTPAPSPRDTLTWGDGAVAWDPTLLEPGVRRYELFVEGNPLGSSQVRLEREDGEWVSRTLITSLMGTQETVLRFRAGDFLPLSLRQEQDTGPLGLAVEVEVMEGWIRGNVELPPHLGESRSWDEALPPGALLPGMEELVLATVELEEGLRLSLPVLDLVQGRVVNLEARVEGVERIMVTGGTFDTWRVRISGGDAPLLLFLRRERPHLLVRQEFQGQPLRLDLSGMAPVP